jgi:peptidoglycan-associated lipoprotein
MARLDNPFIGRRVDPLGAVILGLVLLALSAPAVASSDASPGALLAIYFGPNQTEGAEFKELVVRLDGQEITIPAVSMAADQPLVELPISPGPHVVDVEVRLDGHSELFTYMEDYRVQMRGRLDMQVRGGEVAVVKGSVVSQSGFLVPWEARHRLALASTSYRSDRAARSGGAGPVPETAAASPATLTAPAAAACALEPVTFGFDQATLTPDSVRALTRFADCLGKSSRAVRLEGHCDRRGSAGYNQALGQRRADAVVKFLRKQGVAAARLTSGSLGKSRPLCDEESEACHARNRRVEALPVD